MNQKLDPRKFHLALCADTAFSTDMIGIVRTRTNRKSQVSKSITVICLVTDNSNSHDQSPVHTSHSIILASGRGRRQEPLFQSVMP